MEKFFEISSWDFQVIHCGKEEWKSSGGYETLLEIFLWKTRSFKFQNIYSESQKKAKRKENWKYFPSSYTMPLHEPIYCTIHELTCDSIKSYKMWKTIKKWKTYFCGSIFTYVTCAFFRYFQNFFFCFQYQVIQVKSELR